jgi:3D (Asp-Asp-Asp) domain-containing protein
VPGNSESHAGIAVAALAAVCVPIAGLLGLIILFITVIAPASNASCTQASVPISSEASGGEWVATSYGPPWTGIQGTGVTATGIDLRPAKQAYIIAVDPSVIPLGSFVHVVPNPFNNASITFQAADTGGAIIGHHIDIYDWRGRAAQLEWGSRHVTVTPASPPGSGNLLGATPGVAEASEPGEAEEPAGCTGTGSEGPLPLTPGQSAKVLPDGLAAAPAEAPKAVKEMIAAGNRLDHATYLYGGGHAQSLDTLQPAYDCSSSVSYVLHWGGVFGTAAAVSGELGSYGDAGPGKWVSIYSNSEHAFMFVAGVRFDTVFEGYDTGPNRGQSGPRWRVYPGVPNWAQWVVRHPPGL